MEPIKYCKEIHKVIFPITYYCSTSKKHLQDHNHPPVDCAAVFNIKQFRSLFFINSDIIYTL